MEHQNGNRRWRTNSEHHKPHRHSHLRSSVLGMVWTHSCSYLEFSNVTTWADSCSVDHFICELYAKRRLYPRIGLRFPEKMAARQKHHSNGPSKSQGSHCPTSLQYVCWFWSFLPPPALSY